MKSSRILELYELYHNQRASPEQLKEFKALINDPFQVEQLMDFWKDEWAAISYHDIDNLRINNSDQIFSSIVNHPQVGIKANVKIRLVRRSIAIAAAVATIVFGVWLFNNRYNSINLNGGRLTSTNDIAPGKNTATLQLANGKVITLDTAKNSVVIADSVNTMTTLIASTPRGGTYQVILSDGTKVWLNAASSIRFPSSFSGRLNRQVEITGEVYMEVAKNKAQPFLVISRNQRIEVLGTHFNVNSYDDENAIRTTLLEGSVSVNKKVTLNPGQQSILSGAGNIDVMKVSTTDVVAWTVGDFIFNDEPLESVMRQISRWYNVEIVYAENSPTGIKLGGMISRNKNISSVLKMLELTKDVSFKVEGRRVTVLK